VEPVGEQLALAALCGAAAAGHGLAGDGAGEPFLRIVDPSRARKNERVGERLKGVSALAPEEMLVRAGGARRAALVGALPDATSSRDEVLTYVETLLKSGALALDAPPRRGARRGVAAAAIAAPTRLPTHAIQGTKERVLVRLRFD